MSISSAAGVPTTTAIDFTVGRVDSNGNKTPALKAVYKGLLAGTTVSSLTLVEGTDQLHKAGTPVEITFTAATWNDAVTGITNQHNQIDGSHKGITTDTITVSGLATFNGSLAGITPAKFSNPYKFSSYASASTAVAASFVYTKIGFQTKEYDTGSNFDAVTNFRFTAPIAGFYQFNAAVSQFVQNTTIGDCALYKNGSIVRTGSTWGNNSGGNQHMLSFVASELQLAANDFIEVYARQSLGATANTDNSSNQTYFNGHLVCQT